MQRDFYMTGAEPYEVWPLIRDYHYSRRMPGNIQHCYAVREPGGFFGDSGELIAAAVFSIPVTRWSEDIIELVRLVRHPTCTEPLSKLIAFACRRLVLNGWHLAVSYADWTHRHHGGVYQAAGWLYEGQRARRVDGLLIDGVFKPWRSCNSTYGTGSPEKLRLLLPSKHIELHYDEGKHLYWKPLTQRGKAMAKRLGLSSIAYPKPNATCPSDELMPISASAVQPREVAP